MWPPDPDLSLIRLAPSRVRPEGETSIPPTGARASEGRTRTSDITRSEGDVVVWVGAGGWERGLGLEGERKVAVLGVGVEVEVIGV